jgi:hypothetical protein
VRNLALLALGLGVGALLLALGVFEPDRGGTPRIEESAEASEAIVLPAPTPELEGRPVAPPTAPRVRPEDCPPPPDDGFRYEDQPLHGRVVDDTTGEPVTRALVAFAAASPFPDPFAGMG